MKRMKKWIGAAGYTMFCFLYFYVIFVNFISIPELDTKADVIKYFLMTTGIAVSLPVMLCWQLHYINQLEKKIDELEEQRSD